MSAVDEFLAEVLPRLKEADDALHNGRVDLRHAVWSHNDPVTLFGAAFTRSGWDEIAPAFDWLASRFSNLESSEFEVRAAGVSGELGYVVCIEHTTCSIAGAPPSPYSLRVTTILRREDGQWKVVHRHGDSIPDTDARNDQVRRLLDQVDAARHEA